MTAMFANNASSRLFMAIDAVTTSIRVQSGDGVKFPQPTAGDFFAVTVEDRRSGQIEIMKCTGRSGDILNVVRAQEDTTAQAFAMGATVSNRLTAAIMNILAHASSAENIGTGATVFQGLNSESGAMQFNRVSGTGIVTTSNDVNGVVVNAPVPDWAAITGKPVTFPPTLPIPSSGVTGLDAAQAAQDALIATKEDKANKGINNGYASLDSGGKVPAAQLPSYVDDVVEYANIGAFPPTGSTGLIYVALDTGKIYRWSGSAYVEISPSPGSTDAVPEGSTNLYYTNERVDDRVAVLIQPGTGISWSYSDASGTLTPTVTLAPFTTTNLLEGSNLYYTSARVAADSPVKSVAGKTGVVTLTKTDVGLGNVDNTSDVNKPVSTAQQAALDLKANLASPTFTGDPKAPTPATADNDTSIATTAFVKAQGYGTLADAPSDGLTYGRKNATWATIVGGAVVSDTPPPGPLQVGQLWYEADSGNTYIWYNDGDSSQWVQQNVPPDVGVGGMGDNSSTVADMSIGFRSGTPNRFVVNDKSDMSGTDVLVVSEAGVLSATGSISSSGVISTVANSIISGSGNFVGTAAVAVLGTNAGAGTVYLRPNGSGSGTGQTTIDSSGNMSVAGILTVGSSMTAAHVYSTTNGYFIGSAAAALIGPSSTGGAVYLRPNGYNNATSQTLIADTGAMTVGGSIGCGPITSASTITASTYFASSTTNAVFGPSSGGSFIYLRPAASASTTGQTSIADTGVVATSSWLTTGADYHATGANTGTRVDRGIVRTSANVNTIFAHRQFYNPTGAVGQITTTSGATAYATSSSADLKDVHGDYDPQEAIAIIRADPVKSFTWKIGDGGDAVGWTAQHSHGVKPDLAVHQPAKAGTKDDEPDEPEWWGIDYGQRTPYLWAAVTALLDEVEALKARLAALEGGA